MAEIEFLVQWMHFTNKLGPFYTDVSSHWVVRLDNFTKMLQFFNPRKGSPSRSIGETLRLSVTFELKMMHFVVDFETFCGLVLNLKLNFSANLWQMLTMLCNPFLLAYWCSFKCLCPSICAHKCSYGFSFKCSSNCSYKWAFECYNKCSYWFLTAWAVQRPLNSQRDWVGTLSFLELRFTVYDFVWLRMTMYDYVWLCMTMYD